MPISYNQTNLLKKQDQLLRGDHETVFRSIPISCAYFGLVKSVKVILDPEI